MRLMSTLQEKEHKKHIAYLYNQCRPTRGKRGVLNVGEDKTAQSIMSKWGKRIGDISPFTNRLIVY